jgi:hypothetical protein
MRHLAWITLLGLGTALGPGACNRDIEGDLPGECTDGADNDRDGTFDCDDPDCAGAPICKSGEPTGGGGGGAGGGGGSTTAWQKIACGGVHSCGIRKDGAVVCWGNNAEGQNAAPTSGVFSDLSVSFYHACARASDGTLTCWGCKGTKDNGQCDVPADLIDVDGFDTGTFATCALSSAGSARCWGCAGSNPGQCTPPDVSLDSVTVGALHACGIEAGAAICWGSDAYGQSSPPAGAFVQLDAGTWSTCGVRADGELACWGCASPGPMDPADFGQCDAPKGAFVQVAVGTYHGCGLRSDGTITCWGCLGDDDGVATDLGQCTPPEGTFVSLGVGKYHGCALRADGAVACWGDNYFHQLDVP